VCFRRFVQWVFTAREVYFILKVKKILLVMFTRIKKKNWGGGFSQGDENIVNLSNKTIFLWQQKEHCSYAIFKYNLQTLLF